MSILGKYIANQLMENAPIPKRKNLDILKEFLKFTLVKLGVREIPKGIIISRDLNKVKEIKTFGTFEPGSGKIWVYVGNRNMADILRTLAHELVHYKQQEDGRLNIKSGETGSEIENEANATAGIILREFGQINQNIYESLKNEGIYGDYLFGGERTGAQVGLYPDEVEQDTPAEEDLFKVLHNYLSSEESTYSQINLDKYIPIFKQLKKEYPQIAEPKISSEYVYRGTIIPKEEIDNKTQNHKVSQFKQGTIIHDTVYNSRRNVQSWSTDYYNAASFAMSTYGRKKNGIPVIMRAQISNIEPVFTTEFTNLLSGNLLEDEIFNIKNPVKVDMMVLDANAYEEEFEDIESGYLHTKK